MFIYKSTLDALASAMEDCTQNRDSEQEDENYYEETTEQKENYHSNLLKWGWKKESEDSWGL
jgi:hypothetical protein